MSRLRRDVQALRLSQKSPKDYDPEDERAESEDNSGSDSDEEVTTGGREHYETVGKSKLRRPKTVPLDSKYGGVAVDRNALKENESDVDPFAPQDDDDSDEDPFAGAAAGDDASSEEESRQMKKSDVDRTMTGFSEDEEEIASAGDEGSGSDADADSMEQDDGSDNETDASELEDDSSSPPPPADDKRAALKALLQSQATLASSLSTAAASDVRKGQAVKRQYQTFDRLLDSRMKMQKGLAASDALSKSPSAFTADADSALQAAQSAALTLFNTITSFRETISQSQPSEPPTKKRKSSQKPSNPSDLPSLWSTLTTLESRSHPTRLRTLDKWSSKIKSSDPTQTSSKARFLDPSSSSNNLTSILDTYVINEADKFFRELGAESEVNDEGQPANTHSIPYDDAAFYQSLLRELITTRAATAGNNTDDTLSTGVLPYKLHASGNKQNNKKDTKASKGRKVRYTVHDKLQGFMAAEGDTGRDTAMWTEHGKREFFGSLFGGGRMLREDDEADGEDVGELAEGEALRLFRN